MFLYVCVLAFFIYFYFDTSMGSFLRRRGFYFRFLFALKMAALLKSLFHLQFRSVIRGGGPFKANYNF